MRLIWIDGHGAVTNEQAYRVGESLLHLRVNDNRPQLVAFDGGEMHSLVRSLDDDNLRRWLFNHLVPVFDRSVKAGDDVEAKPAAAA